MKKNYIIRRGISINWLKLPLNIILLCTIFSGFAYGQSDKSLHDVNLSAYDSMSIQEVFEIIEDESDFSFSYHSSDLDTILGDIIDLRGLSERSAYQVLVLISDLENLSFKRNDKTINVFQDTSLNKPLIELGSYTINGVVKDEFGELLPGATVYIKDTNIGTSTNSEGQFSLKVPGGERILVISFVGLITKEISISPETSELNIVMSSDIGSLDELVVVGYGKQTKESITGSISKIESSSITETKSANLANSLAGRIPGVVINARGGAPGQEQIEVFIRGKATTGDASPLYVIDGVANRGSFERLNPEDIESISILKDASAAIYGAQAANGVILITTKRGAEGKPEFSYSNSFSLTQPAKRQQLMNAPQYLTWIDEQNARNNRPVIYQNIIEDYRNGENDPNIWANTDWWDVSMDVWSPQTQHNASLTGGSENFKYYLSGQYLYQDANFIGSAFGYNQSNVRSNIDVTVTSFLDVGLDLAGRFENRDGIEGVNGLIEGIYSMAPFESPYYENGLLRNTSTGNILPGITGLNGGSDANRQVYNTKLSLTLNLDEWLKGVSLDGFGAIDLINQERKVFQKPFDIYFLNSDDIYENLRDETGTISLFQQTDNETSESYHARLNYSREFGKHSIGGFVAYEQNQVSGEYISATRIDLVSEDLPFLFTGSEQNIDNDGRGWQSARVNYFGRFNYAFDDKYFLELTLRHDGSQNFSPGDRFGTFPGISAGWRISEENFFNFDIVSELKLRASWGQLGNDRVNSFQYLQIYNVETASVFGENPNLSVGLVPGRTPNPNITWETAEKTNVGVDFSLSRGLLDVTIDWFYEKRSDILAPRNASVPLYSGIELPDENIGITNNRGIELSILHRSNVKNDFRYSVGGQLTYARNEIEFVDESPFVPEYQQVEGSPIDFLLVYKAEGIYQNQEEINKTPHFPDAKPGDVRFADVNGDGKITADDRILLPYGPTPRIVYGFNVGANWRGLEISAFLQGQHGAKTIYRPWDINQDEWYFENRWISEDETPNAKSPAAWDMSSSTIQNVSTIWVKDNHFLRIKNVELAYTFPKKFSENLRLSNLKFNMSAFNLGFIYNSVGLYDPESRSDTGWYYPQQRVISAGLSATF
ncbi:MAG TPA: TonB-dependent receptor [Balneolaceae bacterium]|nr:TonB-dependent receptor [Balneolaceae bacterium]